MVDRMAPRIGAGQKVGGGAKEESGADVKPPNFNRRDAVKGIAALAVGAVVNPNESAGEDGSGLGSKTADQVLAALSVHQVDRLEYALLNLNIGYPSHKLGFYPNLPLDQFKLLHIISAVEREAFHDVRYNIAEYNILRVTVPGDPERQNILIDRSKLFSDKQLEVMPDGGKVREACGRARMELKAVIDAAKRAEKARAEKLGEVARGPVVTVSGSRDRVDASYLHIDPRLKIEFLRREPQAQKK